MFRILLFSLPFLTTVAFADFCPSSDEIQRGGTAYIARANTIPSNTTLGETGWLSPSGQPMLSSGNPKSTATALFGLSATQTLTKGTDRGAMSQALLENFLVKAPAEVFGGGLTVTTESHCNCDEPTILARTELSDLTIQGIQQRVTGATNQVIYLPNGFGRVVVNEQIAMKGPFDSRIEVNGLHIQLVTGQDIVLGHAEAEVHCR